MTEVSSGTVGCCGDLEVVEVSARFGGVRALRDVSIRVPRGAIVGVIGPNGAGKTTLFNVVCGFVAADSGVVFFNGRSLVGVRPHQLARLGIARTLQGVRVFEGLTAVENVMVGHTRLHRRGVLAALLGLPSSDRSERILRARAMEMLATVGISDVADRPARSLPYPVQKRVAFARALMVEPSLLLLDEPAGGLGADDVVRLAGLLRGLRGEMTVMLVEHRMDLVMSVCDHVVVLDSGRLIASGTPDEATRDPAVLEAFLGSDEQDGALGGEEVDA